MDKFQCEILASKWSDDGRTDFRFTQDGHQWMTVSIPEDRLVDVAMAMLNYYRNNVMDADNG